MKNIKKTLVMCICLVLIAVMAIGGTVAYLTVDPQEKGNVFSVGNIAINLTEDVGKTGAATVTSDDNGATYENVMPGDYLKKEVTVENTGSRPAYVAVEVTINNALEINKAIDEFYEAKGYSEAEIQQIYDYIFDGFGMNYTKTDANGNATGMRLTITGDKMPEKVLQVDSVKTISEYWLQYSGNWFMDTDTVIPYDGYYTTGMNDYELRYTYYLLLEAGEKSTLFKGLNVPKEFNAQQLDMFEEMNIKVVASAIQADNIAGDKEAFTILNRVNNGEEMDLKFVSKWDGTADTTWYDPANPQTEYKLSTAAQLAGLAELVSADTTFDGVTFILTKDIDLYCEDTTADADGDPLTFRPIGDKSKNGTFEGTFDGNGKTISNLYQNGWDLGYQWGIYGSYGLFGNLNDATVKNLTITGSESYIEGGDVSFIAGSATGNCVFENITIKDSIAATYNNGCGGIIGWSGAGNYTFKNITIADDAVLAGLWGSFDSSIGGIVGQGEPGATYNFENVDIACRIDAYNDCTASYDYYNYRMCGMIIGRLEETTSIDGANYPDVSKYNINCNDVTVTYGDWANYHYCRATGERAARVEAGYSYGGVAADYDHSKCTAHHMELIEFDQIFGGDQYAVKGLKSYDGVNVIYNNK